MQSLLMLQMKFGVAILDHYPHLEDGISMKSIYILMQKNFSLFRNV